MKLPNVADMAHGNEIAGSSDMPISSKKLNLPSVVDTGIRTVRWRLGWFQPFLDGRGMMIPTKTLPRPVSKSLQMFTFPHLTTHILHKSQELSEQGSLVLKNYERQDATLLSWNLMFITFVYIFLVCIALLCRRSPLIRNVVLGYIVRENLLITMYN
ncbi:uncharacterized protein LOC111877646 [Lactuca sativa]|uniref:uncharacterized protein LOC111877646 n=1 Tax=Lactuca sativa TaxID=4236 RepID=UPI001C6923FE|nr:uncharacterized protein LOC111877646 [Lactuca sativa]